MYRSSESKTGAVQAAPTPPGPGYRAGILILFPEQDFQANFGRGFDLKLQNTIDQKVHVHVRRVQDRVCTSGPDPPGTRL